MSVRRTVLLLIPLTAAGVAIGVQMSSQMPRRFETTREVFVSPLPAAQLAGAEVYREWNTREPDQVMDREVAFATAIVQGQNGTPNQGTSVVTAGQTGIMSFHSYSTAPDAALAAGEMATTAYIDGRTVEFANSITGAADALQLQIDALNKQIAAVTDAGYWVADNERNRLLDRRAELAKHKDQLDTALAAFTANPGVSVVSVSAPHQVWPNPRRAGAIGGIIGADVAIALAFLLSRSRSASAPRPGGTPLPPPPRPDERAGAWFAPSSQS